MCTITPTSLAVGQLLSATDFNTESGFDKLIVNGESYSGTWTSRPRNVVLGSAFTWSSDYSYYDTGWELCAHAAAQAAHLTVDDGDLCTINGVCVSSPNYPRNYG